MQKEPALIPFIARMRIWRQLLLLSFLVVLPSLAIIGYTGLEQRREALEKSKTECYLLTSQVAMQIQGAVENTRQFLSTLAEYPDIQSKSSELCGPFFADILRKNPRFNSLQASTPDGMVFASGTSLTQSLYVGDRKYFRDAMETKKFSAGEYIITRTAKKPSINFSYPLLDKSGNVQMILQAGFELSAIPSMLKSVNLPPKVRVLLIDHAGTLLYYSTDPARTGVKDAPERFSVMWRGQETGYIPFVDSANEKRLVFFQKLRLTPSSSPYMYVRVSIPEESVYSNARKVITVNALLLGLALLLAYIGAWSIGHRYIARRLDHLVKTTEQLSRGDLSVRTRLPHEEGDIGHLAAAIDTLSSALETQSMERKRAEENLAVTRQRTMEMLDSVKMIAIMLDKDATITFANRFAHKLTGWSESELQGRNWFEVCVPEESRERRRKIVRDAMITGLMPNHYEGEIITRGNQRRLIAWNHTVLFDPQGKAEGIASFGMDITDTRRLEEQLRQAQKMDAIGQLAGGVAHDFNNLLTGILGCAEILKLDAEDNPAILEVASTIQSAAERAADLTKKLLGFARRGKFLILPVDVNATMREISGLLERTLEKTIRVKLRLCEKDAKILGDPGQIHQAILNLAVNARDAMPEGGELTLATEITELDAEFCKQQVGLSPGKYIKIEVSDTGVGIPPEIRERIFEPFFSTKEPGKGTGMGLAMVYGIVNNHNGAIRLYSEMGMGTVFRIFIPLLATAGSEEESTQTSPARGEGHILLVDDEKLVLETCRRMLTVLGYRVSAFEKAADAVEYYRQHHREVDLVIIDMVMPEMDGRDCFRALRAINPEIRALLSSGYGIDGKAQKILAEGMKDFISKPYKMNELAEAISLILSKHTPDSSLR